MKRTPLIATTALGLVLGAVLFNAPRAYAQLATIDVAAIAQAVKSVAAETGILDVIQAMQTVQQTMSDTMKAVNTALGTNTYGDTNTLLLQGFTQNANYSKAQVGAIQQIVDASNTANARFARDMRNAQIRDEQTASPTHCAAIDGGVSTQSASIGAFQVGQTMAAIHDTRGEAGPGMPSYYGQAQGVASMWAAHVGQYCDTTEGAANLCPNGVSANPDADQKASNLFGNGAYADQTAVNTAKDRRSTRVGQWPGCGSAAPRIQHTHVARADLRRQRGRHAGASDPAHSDADTIHAKYGSIRASQRKRVLVASTANRI